VWGPRGRPLWAIQPTNVTEIFVAASAQIPKKIRVKYISNTSDQKIFKISMIKIKKVQNFKIAFRRGTKEIPFLGPGDGSDRGEGYQ